MNQLRKYGYEVNFGINKIKAGSGEHVIYTLNKLADEALKAKNFNWNEPEYPAEQFDEEEEENADEIDEAELDINKIEENMLKYENDDGDEEEAILSMDALSKMNNLNITKVLERH
jgi:intraflagellar transport protein 57